ncbi:MAG TPA: o-succinylbenzoate--CoA ligase [Gemmatimonadaceae bacterium]|nr:o-succinylbenzoate--CoA ligase [Gemmatimonadaceae bacterium]
MTEVPDHFADWIATRAETIPDRVALSVGERSWSFAELDAEISTLARKLGSAGIGEGDRVATILHNGILAAMLPHALLRLSATLVPLNVRLSEAEIAWQIADVNPRLVIVEERTRHLCADAIDTIKLAAIIPAPVEFQMSHRSEHVAAIIYTSGTTGRPKGAMLTLGNFWWSAAGSALNLGVSEDDRWIACLPLFHVGGLSIVFRSAIYGTCVVVHDGFDAAAINADIDRGATLVSVVSVMLERLLDDRATETFPPSFRCALVGGGPTPRMLLERCISVGLPVAHTYGLTETCSQAATLSPADAIRKLGSAGIPLHPNEIRIDGSEGEILVRGPIVMSGYYNNPEASERVLEGGWLHTGDIGRLDSEGFLYVLDRRDDLIITGGENVYPAEVESALLAHDSVVEAAVIGVEDSTWGQRVVAVARVHRAVDQQDLAAHCRTLLAAYKVPREFRFTNEPLPRTASGKIRRALLRDSITKR